MTDVEKHAESLKSLSDEELTAKAEALRKECDDTELVALTREAAERAIGQRPFDVQVLGALGLLSGLVVEMATGEGKTLAGAMAAAGFAIKGKRVHVVSVNDYLAQRDAEWMGPLYRLLGISVGWINGSSKADERREAYQCEVTYAPVSEIGFDVLRDRIVTNAEDLIVPEPQVALIDEADSVLVDEAARAARAGRLDQLGGRRPGDRRPGEAAAARAALRGRRRGAQRLPDGCGLRGRRAGARRDRPVLAGARDVDAVEGERGVARAGAAAPRRGLHRARRQGAPDQRHPWPRREAAAVAGRSAGRGRGQGERADDRVGRDPRLDDGAGAAVAVPDALRHDGYGRGRRGDLARVLRARGARDPAEQGEHPRGRALPPLRDAGAEGSGDRRRRSRRPTSRAARSSSARSTSPSRSGSRRSCARPGSSAWC